LDQHAPLHGEVIGCNGHNQGGTHSLVDRVPLEMEERVLKVLRHMVDCPPPEFDEIEGSQSHTDEHQFWLEPRYPQHGRFPRYNLSITFVPLIPDAPGALSRDQRGAELCDVQFHLSVNIIVAP
jgi:hypothetical protein